MFERNVAIMSLKLLIIATLMVKCEGYKILVVFPHPARSHGNLGDGLVRHLLKAGHEVTYITPFVKDTPQQNLTYIDVSTTSKIFAAMPLNIERILSKETALDQHRIFHMMRNISILAFGNENMKNFLEHSTESFDVVVAEWMFNELHSGFSAVFKCPYIWVFPFEPNFVALSLIDEDTNPAYAANIELNITPPFTFLQRIRNLLFQITYKLNYYFYYEALEKETYESVFAPILMKRHGFVEAYDELRYNASLMLSYSNNPLSQALKLPQNLIPVGGYHVDDNPPPLPTDLKKIMDDGKNGVIYFSMGSNLKSKDFAKTTLDNLIKVFSEIEHTIVWKFEANLTNYPNNVHIVKWAPQQSILAHPNCILFITHGGLLSTTEAIHFGVPIIGIPVFFDQFSNVNRAVMHGFAKKVELGPNFANDLKATIKDILTDVRYTTKAKELSLIYHDSPVTPGASLVHSVEHVVKTHGASHLRSPAFSVPWYQKYYLDLIALIIIVLGCALFCIAMLVTMIREFRVDILRKKVTKMSLKTLIIVTLIELCEGYKILVVFPHPARSHGNLGNGLVRHLLNAGHEVTYITPFMDQILHQNVTYVDVTCTNIGVADNPFSIQHLMNKEQGLNQDDIFHLTLNVSMLALENENMKNFLEHSTNSFDVVIAEWLFNELYCGFAAVFKCPYIWMYPFEPNFVALGLIDEDTNPSYVANLEVNNLPPFTFMQRVKNLWFQITYKFNRYYYYDALEKEVYERSFAPILRKKYGFVDSYDVLRYNASLMLSYSHNSISQAIKMPQNLIPIGGYHVGDNPPPLSTDLKKIMDDGKDGVIYFSMGSNMKSKDFPKTILDDLIKMFGEIKHTVLWKFEGDLKKYPDNVHILKWAPQQSILAHPNCVLFITHGGLLSTTEAVHFGVPIIGVPVFYDQFSNIDRAVKRGFAKKVTLGNNFTKKLKAAIEDILTDIKYRTKAKELSFIYHDRPIKPGASLVHWVQHVVETRGAPHLRSSALFVPWYQKYYVDLVALIMIVLGCILFVILKLIDKSKEYRVDIQRKKLA
ncbi:uncharacterized protein [Epargyreus clarus]|uniref:uncharacterized protein n=1 Tax=Epargyreus clarus TaxID=520877 RepID=UPI003C2FD8A9